MKLFLTVALAFAMPIFTGFKFTTHWATDISLAGITKEMMATAPNPNGWLAPEARTLWQSPDRDSKVFHSMFPTAEKFLAWIETLENSGRSEVEFEQDIHLAFTNPMKLKEMRLRAKSGLLHPAPPTPVVKKNGNIIKDSAKEFAKSL